MRQKTEKQKRKINESKIYFFENISTLEKPLAGLTKKKIKIQINRIISEKRDCINDSIEIKKRL